MNGALGSRCLWARPSIARGQRITRNGQIDNGGSKDRARNWLATASLSADGFAFAEPVEVDDR
jgi:hypothetical protein